MHFTFANLTVIPQSIPYRNVKRLDAFKKMALMVSTNTSVRRTLLLVPKGVRPKRFYCNFFFRASWKVMPKIFFGNTFLTIYWEKYVDFHFSGIKKRSDFCCKQSVGGRVIYKEI